MERALVTGVTQPDSSQGYGELANGHADNKSTGESYYRKRRSIAWDAVTRSVGTLGVYAVAHSLPVLDTS